MAKPQKLCNNLSGPFLGFCDLPFDLFFRTGSAHGVKAAASQAPLPHSKVEGDH
jgi:hypothetical protein